MTDRVTMQDVADASGVSRATVSFVLNDVGNQRISAETRERVRAAAERLGYRTHGIARALREGTSRIVVLYMDAGAEGHYSRSFVDGLDDELARHGHVLLVRHRGANEDERRRVAEAVVPRAVVDFAGSYARPGHELDDAGAGWQDGLAAHAAAQVGYLVERGHSHIAMALPLRQPPVVAARLAFSREVAIRLDIAPIEALVVPTPRDEAAAALRVLLDQHPEVTAVAGYSDDVALRVLAAADDLGLAVPDRLAVMGYDATDYSGLVSPALTTLRIDAEAHGRRVARRLLGLDEAGLVLEPARVIARASA